VTERAINPTSLRLMTFSCRLQYYAPVTSLKRLLVPMDINDPVGIRKCKMQFLSESEFEI
jgi:hypothetical protein